MEMNKQSFSFGLVRCTVKSASADNKLKKIALTGIDDLPAAASRRLDLRPGRSLYVIGARADPPVGKFNVDPRADRDCRRGPQRAPIAVAHQRKTSRQHAAIRPEFAIARCLLLPRRVGAR